MIKDSNNKRVTPNQVAKARIIGVVENACYWSENYPDLAGMVTDEERAAIDKAVEKQIRRVVKSMGGYKNFHVLM